MRNSKNGGKAPAHQGLMQTSNAPVQPSRMASRIVSVRGLIM